MHYSLAKRSVATFVGIALGLQFGMSVLPAEALTLNIVKPARGQYQATKKTLESAHRQIFADGLAGVAPKALVNGYARYSNNAIGLSLEYPKGWKQDSANKLEIVSGSKPDAGRTMVGFFAPDDADNKDRFVVLRAEMSLYPQTVTMDDLDTDFLKIFNFDVRTNKMGTYTYYVPNMGAVTHAATKVGAYDGKRYTFTSEKSGYKYSLTQVSIPVGKRLYQLQLLTDLAYEKEAAVAFEHLLQTVTFREPTFTKSATKKAQSAASSRPTLKKR